MNVSYFAVYIVPTRHVVPLWNLYYFISIKGQDCGNSRALAMKLPQSCAAGAIDTVIFFPIRACIL